MNKDLENRFSYHAPTTFKVGLHGVVREKLLLLAEELSEFLPDGREKSLFITKLEEAMFWANAAIARTEMLPNLEYKEEDKNAS